MTDAVMLGRAITAARSELGMKRSELATRAGVSYPYLSELENGTKGR
jgi:transcriptional regulator with XRE-family HTH domain